ARVVLELGLSQRLQERWQVHAEPPPQSLLEAVPTAQRVVRGSSPRLDGAFLGRLLLVGASELYPVAAALQHRVQVLDRARVVEEGCLADDADEHLSPVPFVEEHLVVRGQRRRLQPPRIVFRPRSAHRRSPKRRYVPISSNPVTTGGSSHRSSIPSWNLW